ncbi:MAG: flavin oxidoreductase [Flavobacterium sp.]|uniref:flavin reductase family protein n=1 Tax=Flavobacterium sp. TaxID=239 RepID=UPI000C5B13BB|nr:flavin reductase family protein [Flavobacterium sp.]MBF03315.1 flavin oxidoreductase [Flavobacterium sp.]|tara:strand:- start:3060 stop:3707 length:648 start_codon:yes stop_codon:yes gene_type:complete
MKKITKKDLEYFDKIARLNLINSITGYKSANLIGTVSKKGILNLAIFSSVTHLGSDPALLGFIVRPTIVPRNTYANIKETGSFTVNAVTESLIQKAHQTAANYPEIISEFEVTQIASEFIENIDQPFVKESPVKLWCKYVNEYPIIENDCILIIASIEAIYLDENLIQKDKWVHLEKGKIVTINGLDGYCLPRLLDRFEYARPNTIAQSLLKNGS